MKLRSSFLDCGDKLPLSTKRHVASFQSADLSTHPQMLIRTAIVTVLLAILSICLFGVVLHSKSGVFHEVEAGLLSVEWMLLFCLAIWCGSFIFLTFSANDLPLIGLLIIGIAAYFFGEEGSWKISVAVILLGGVTLGRGTRVFLGQSLTRSSTTLFHPMGEGRAEGNFLIGLVVLLAFSSWWHLTPTGAYHGPRWMGLWDNPNIYGMLMGAGVVLVVGLLALTLTLSQPMGEGISRWTRALQIILLVAAGMMAVGLFFSYSRGAWLGTAVGLLYLAKAHGKLKWRHVMLGVGLLALGVLCFWGRTPDNAPWYVKRMDFGRPSAQHRVSAWRGALQMMRDHPLGVGWNKAAETYEKNYSPPVNGAAAITMNSYLMLGTELGLPGLVCFVAYVALCFRSSRPHLTLALSPPAAGNGEGINSLLFTYHSSLQTACRAGAVVFLVAFWFDGGLFTLATASLFWVLLELGSVSKTETKQIPCSTN
jgi:O-antigen ligase